MSKQTTKVGIIGCGNISDIYFEAGKKFDILDSSVVWLHRKQSWAGCG